MKKFLKKIALSTLIITSFAFGAIFINGCSLQPQAWQPPTKPKFKDRLTLNNKLQNIQKIDLNGWYGPEDIIKDTQGNLYCGVHKGAQDFSDGKILKISPNGQIDAFYEAGAWVAGIHFDTNGNLIALVHAKGLVKIAPNGKATLLAQQDENNRKFLFPNGMDIAANGKIYFSITAHQASYDIRFGRKLILEIKPKGGLYEYNPENQQVKTLINGTYFGNGVVVSKNQEYLLIVETTKYRVLKYWLNGEKEGQTEVFMDNLPGFPNGISIREDGSYWLGFTTLRNDALDNIHPKKGLKKFVYGLPAFLQPKQEKFGMVLNISEKGEILQALFDPKGNQVPEAGAVKEFDGKLFIGGDIVPYISVFELENYSTQTSIH